MISHNGPGCALDEPKRLSLESAPAMLCWALYTGLNKTFADYIREKWTSLDTISGSGLIVNVFEVPERSLEIRSGLLGSNLSVGLSDLPCLLFFDSYFHTDEVAVCSINDESDLTITSELSFVLDVVRHTWKCPPVPGSTDYINSQAWFDEIVHARRNCIIALRSKIRLRKVHLFLRKNGLDLLKLAGGLIKPSLK